MTPHQASQRAGSLYLHVGPPKTGSTAMQWLLTRLEPELKESNVRIEFFQQSANASPFFDSLQTALGRAESSVVRFEQNIVQRLETSAVVISAESLSTVDSDVLWHFRERVSPRRISVLFVARPLDRALRSWWSERLRHGLAENLNTYVRRIVTDPEDFAIRIKTTHTLQRLQDVFGEEHVFVTAAPSSRPNTSTLVEVLERWLEVELPSFSLDIPVLDRHPHLTEDEAIAQFIVNSVVKEVALLSDVPYAFSTQYRIHRERVARYLETGLIECADLITNLALSELNDLKVHPMTFLDSRQEFFRDYVAASEVLSAST